MINIIYSDSEIISSNVEIDFIYLISLVRNMEREFITMDSLFISSIFKSSNGGIAFQVSKGSINILSLTYNFNLTKLREEIDQTRKNIENIILVERDSLTGFLGRKSLMLSCYTFKYLLIVDIDNFKQINDTKGHMEGDRILSLFSLLLKEHFADSQIFRYGGDEFVIICNSNIADVERKICSVNLHLKEINRVLSLSYGFSCNQTIKIALAEADKMLYKNKLTKKSNKC